MVFDRSAVSADLEHAFAQRKVPLIVELIADVAIAALYQRAMVLVRPDGHVAWRGDSVEDADRIVDVVRGAG